MPHDVPKAENSHEPERDTRDQILDAAQNLFLARGYKAVAMKDIAEAVHITSAALYYHFSQGKEEVLLEMLQKMIGQWSEQLRHAIAQGGLLPDQLRRVVGIVSALPFDRLPMLVRDIQTQLSDRSKSRFHSSYSRVSNNRSRCCFNTPSTPTRSTMLFRL